MAYPGCVPVQTLEIPGWGRLTKVCTHQKPPPGLCSGYGFALQAEPSGSTPDSSTLGMYEERFLTYYGNRGESLNLGRHLGPFEGLSAVHTSCGSTPHIPLTLGWRN